MFAENCRRISDVDFKVGAGDKERSVERIHLDTSTCIPCMLPYGISQFLTRAKGDRPVVVPEGSKNFAFLGQFVEIPDGIVFTTEYSVRGAIAAVKKFVKPSLEVPPMYFGQARPAHEHFVCTCRVLLVPFQTYYDG